MDIQYKLKNSDEMQIATILHTHEFKRFEVIEKSGCIEIKQDKTTLFYLAPGVGDEIEEIRITNIKAN